MKHINKYKLFESPDTIDDMNLTFRSVDAYAFGYVERLYILKNGTHDRIWKNNAYDEYIRRHPVTKEMIDGDEKITDDYTPTGKTLDDVTETDIIEYYGLSLNKFMTEYKIKK